MNLPELSNRLRGLSEYQPGEGLRRADPGGLSGDGTGARIGTQGSRRNGEIDGAESFATKGVDLKLW
jgi:hypothetical protein